MTAGIFPSRSGAGRCLVILCCIPLLGGCANYRWTTDYQAAEDYAHQQGKHLFIFYKWWLSNESNRMHGDVLSDPAVASRLRDTVNVLLEKDSSPEYGRFMSKFGVTQAPAFVIVAPDGSFQVRTGFIPKDRFIDFIESGKTVRPSRRPSEPHVVPRPPPRAQILVP